MPIVPTNLQHAAVADNFALVMQARTTIRTQFVAWTYKSVQACLAGNKIAAEKIAFRRTVASVRTQRLADFTIKVFVAFTALSVGDLLEFRVVVRIYLWFYQRFFLHNMFHRKNEAFTFPTIVETLDAEIVKELSL
jgi:hypothetical protein